MTTQAPSRTLPPTSEEALIARESSRLLAAVLETRGDTQQIELSTSSGGSKPVTIPVSARGCWSRS